MAKTDGIKRTITFLQKKKKKKFFIKKKQYFSLASKSKNFRFFDEDGYEIFDPVFIAIIFDSWYTDYSENTVYDVMTELNEAQYAIFEEDEIESVDSDTEYSTGNSEPYTLTEEPVDVIEEYVESDVIGVTGEIGEIIETVVERAIEEPIEEEPIEEEPIEEEPIEEVEQEDTSFISYVDTDDDTDDSADDDYDED